MATSTPNVNKDLIISYTVSPAGGLSEEYTRLTEALENSYKVVDIFSTAQTTGGGGGAGGGSGVTGGVCVTVFLSHYSEDTGVFHQYVGGKR
ncbi:MAG: hypothetical protein HC771_16290 [Synechococcales cyanobacterium CRU_2_2]|nr:hypothetical protein [Synechococcales cyanobacterium CRU_2_2]